MSNKIVEELSIEICNQCSSKFSDFLPVICIDEIILFRDNDQIIFKGTILEFIEKYMNK